MENEKDEKKERPHRKIILRKDLEIIKADDNSLEIKDPSNGQFFYIGERDALAIELLSKMDVNEFLEKTEYHKEDLIQLIKTLKNYNLLEGFKHEQSSKKQLKKNKLEFLTFRKVLGNPDSILMKIEPKFNFLFGKPLIIILLTVLGLFSYFWADKGINFIAYGWPLIGNSWFISLFCFMALLFIVLIGHELSHGLALKHFKGTVKELGFCLIYILPSFYSDLTDVYKLKNSKERAIVMVAGPLFQIFVGCISFLIWTQVISHSLLGDLFYLLTFACFFSLIVNINPFLKLDGYYVLEFYLHIYDLRMRSWRYIKSLIMREVQKDNLSVKEKTVFLLYAPISIIYTLLLLSWILGFYFDNVVLAAPMSFLVLTSIILLLYFSQDNTADNTAVSKSQRKFKSEMQPFDREGD